MLRQRQCKWPVIAGWYPAQLETVIAGISPLPLINFLDDPIFQLARAWKCNGTSSAADERRLDLSRFSGTGAAARQTSYRLPVLGFSEHAVGFAMTDVFEEHDRNHFEIFAYYCGIDRVDPTRLRIKNSAHRWTEINGLSDEQAAAKIREDEVDIRRSQWLHGIRANSILQLAPGADRGELVRVPVHDGQPLSPLYHCR